MDSTLTPEFSSNTESPAIKTAKLLVEELKRYGFTNPRIFHIAGNVPEATKHALNLAGVSHTELLNKKNIVVEQRDYERCSRIAGETAQMRQSFLQEYGEMELEKIIHNHPNIPDKRMLQLRNISSIEKDAFLNRCNNIKPGLLLESMRNEDNTYTISIPQALLSREERRKVVSAYIHAVFSVSGVTAAARAYGGDNFTKENYLSGVKEHRMVDDLVTMIHDKLADSGLTADSFAEYFSSVKSQIAYALKQLQSGHELTGFEEQRKEEVKKAFAEFSKDTHAYTGDFFNRHSISSKEAVGDTREIPESPTPQKEQEI